MAKKTIYFEGLGLVEGHFSGIGQYILGILRGVDEIIEEKKLLGEEVPNIRVIIPYTTRAKFRTFNFKHIQPKLFPLSFRIMSKLWHAGKMPPIDLYCGKGFYVFTRFVTMPLAFSPSAVVIYDLSFELHKEYSDDGNAKFLSKGTRRSVKQVNHVFTISKNAKKEIHDFYGVDKKEITVATPAADQRYLYRRSPKEVSRVKYKYGLEGDYILALSNLEPRKNLNALVDAYCALPNKYRESVGLLLVGVNGWKSDALFEKIIDKVKDGYNIMRANDYVSDADKPAIISGAKMLVYPSHYEGFGMPPLEALACGVPVISADNSSLPEVVGSDGVMVNCNDIEGLTEQIKLYLDNMDTITKSVIRKGPVKAEQFSWKQSAQLYIDHIYSQDKS